jgi:hypothetical protein
MKKYTILAIMLLGLLLGGCTQDFRLENSIFIEDMNNPGLPEYSEWGYNSFGAYVDREIFASNSVELPAKIIITKDTFNFLLKGVLNKNVTTLRFSIIGYAPAAYPGLITLNDSTFDLTGKNCLVTLTDKFSTTRLQVFEGKLVFKRVQKLNVDKTMTESILSGTFNFKTFDNGEPIAVTNGRFDVGVGDDNFFKF